MIIVMYFISPVYASNQAIEIETASVVQNGIVSTVSAKGKIEEEGREDIFIDQTAYVVKVFVKEGETVKKGQKLMEITPSPYDAEGLQTILSARLENLSVENLVKAYIDQYGSCLLYTSRCV